MKNLIGKILREEMVSMIQKHNIESHIIKNGNTITCNTLISKDNETHDKLYLFVGFNQYNEYTEYSYSFILVNKDNKPLTNYMTERDLVRQYLPQNIIKNKPKFPLVMDMTRKLLDEHLPQNIYRKTSESIGGDSLKRYEEITKIMVNEYGYILTKTEKTKDGRTMWYLTKDTNNILNNSMDENYVITHEYTFQETSKRMFDWVLPLLPKE